MVEFMKELATVLDVEPEKLEPTRELESYAWDSFAMASCAALAQTHFGKSVSPQGLWSCRTVKDLLGALGAALLLLSFTPAHAAITAEPSSTILVENISVRPGAVALTSDAIFFSELSDHASGPARCHGKDLYRISAADKKEEKLLTLPCVLTLSVVDDKLHVESFDGTATAFQRLDGKTLVPPLETTLPAQLARLKAALWSGYGKKELASPRATFERYATSPNGLTALLTPLEGHNQFLIATLARNPETRPTLSPITLTPDEEKYLGHFSDLVTSGSGTVYVLKLPSNGELAKVAAITSGKLEKFDWGTFEPHSLTATADGFLIYDRTEKLGHSRSVFAYSESTKKALGLRLPSSDIGGLFLSGTHLVLSKPRTHSVVWHGPASAVPSAFAGGPIRLSATPAADYPKDLSAALLESRCPAHVISEERSGVFSISRRTKDEVLLLADGITGLKSFDCLGDTIAFLAKEFRPNLANGHLVLSAEKEPVEAKAKLYVLRGSQALPTKAPFDAVLEFARVRVSPDKKALHILLNEKGKLFDDFIMEMTLDGAKFEGQVYDAAFWEKTKDRFVEGNR